MAVASWGFGVKAFFGALVLGLEVVVVVEVDLVMSYSAEENGVDVAPSPWTGEVGLDEGVAAG